MKTFDFLKKYLLDMGFEDSELNKDSLLRELELDSTEKVDLALAIKKKFGKSINLDDDNVTLSDLCAKIEGEF